MNDRYIEECRNDLLQMNGGVSATQSTSQNRIRIFYYCS